jgi:hypothetical protein
VKRSNGFPVAGVVTGRKKSPVMSTHKLVEIAASQALRSEFDDRMFFCSVLILFLL